MAIQFQSSKDVFFFKHFTDPGMKAQNIALFVSLAFFVIGIILTKKFSFSELVFLPFSLCFMLYGFFIIGSKKLFSGFVVYTQENAQRMGFLYLLFGLVMTMILVFGAYMRTFR